VNIDAGVVDRVIELEQEVTGWCEAIGRLGPGMPAGETISWCKNELFSTSRSNGVYSRLVIQ
jgi:hypothetical protein